jgi:hypothetical protein
MKVSSFYLSHNTNGTARLECGHVIENLLIKPIFEMCCPVCEPNKTMFAVSQDRATQRQVFTILILNKMREEGISI